MTDPVLLLLLWLVFMAPVIHAQGVPPTHMFVDSLSFNVQPIADTTPPYDLFEQLTNLPHVITRKSVLQRGGELTIALYDTVDRRVLDQYERYLRNLGTLSSITFEFDGNHPGDPNQIRRGTLITTTEDGWSLIVEPYRQPGDGVTSWLLTEKNFLGRAKKIGLGGDLSDPGDSEWRGVVKYDDPDVVATGVQLRSLVAFSSPQTTIRASLIRPFYTDASHFGYGANLALDDGRNVYRRHEGDPESRLIMDTSSATRYQTSAWFSTSNREQDQFYAGGAVHLDSYSNDSGLVLPHAFQNTVGLSVGIGSLRSTYERLRGYDFSGERMVPIGGYGSVSISKFFTIDEGTDNLIFFAVDARKSVYSNGLYGFAGVRAGTGIRDRDAELTLLRLDGSFGMPLGPGTVAMRASQQTIWRWNRYVWQPATVGDVGLRGYDDTEVFGDNYLKLNVDYRLFPLLDLGLWEGGLTLFYDVAGVWNQGQKFGKSRFHNAAGIGFRLGDSNGFNAGFLRVDIAWNFDRNTIGTINFGVHEAFDLFGTLEYTPPGPHLP